MNTIRRKSMSDERWEVASEVAGDLQAELIRGLLEAQGIRVWLSQEGAGRAYGLSLGLLGRVQILVPSDSVEKARSIIDEYYAQEAESDNNTTADDEDIDLDDIQ
jgi:hypothetical protein